MIERRTVRALLTGRAIPDGSALSATQPIWTCAPSRPRRRNRDRSGSVADVSQSSFLIAGPAHFQADVRWVLDELAAVVPRRHREVLRFLPRAVYDPAEVNRHHPGAAAIASGHFAIDSSSPGGADFFRFALLHEAGHNIRARWAGGRIVQYSSEAEADSYANLILAELRAARSHPRIGVTLSTAMLPYIPLPRGS